MSELAVIRNAVRLERERIIASIDRIGLYPDYPPEESRTEREEGWNEAMIAVYDMVDP